MTSSDKRLRPNPENNPTTNINFKHPQNPMSKKFVMKKLNFNGVIVDARIPVSALDTWKDLIVE